MLLNSFIVLCDICDIAKAFKLLETISRSLLGLGSIANVFWVLLINHSLIHAFVKDALRGLIKILIAHHLLFLEVGLDSSLSHCLLLLELLLLRVNLPGLEVKVWQLDV